jgi:hypothetical protein
MRPIVGTSKGRPFTLPPDFATRLAAASTSSTETYDTNSACSLFTTPATGPFFVDASVYGSPSPIFMLEMSHPTTSVKNLAVFSGVGVRTSNQTNLPCRRTGFVALFFVLAMSVSPVRGCVAPVSSAPRRTNQPDFDIDL